MINKQYFLQVLRPALRKLGIDENNVTEITFRDGGFSVRYIEAPAAGSPVGTAATVRQHDGTYDELASKPAKVNVKAGKVETAAEEAAEVAPDNEAAEAAAGGNVTP